VAFRNLAVPWLSGGLVVLGYAAFSWLRSKRSPHARPAPELGQRRLEVTEPLAARLEQVPDEAALNLESETLPANSNALPRTADLGALFLGRASGALSPFNFGGKF